MQPFIRQTLGNDVEINVIKRSELQILFRYRANRASGHGVKAMLAKQRASSGEYDALIYMVDADSNNRADWLEIVRQIEAGFQSSPGGAACIACVPMSASESWMMADPSAWKSFANYDGSDLPPRPETIWGNRDDPAGGHPHRFFRRVCDEAGVADCTDTRAELARDTNLVTARANCPISLEHFLCLLESLLTCNE